MTTSRAAHTLYVVQFSQDTERFQRDAALQQRKAEREAAREAERVAKEEAKLKVLQERAAKREAQEAEKEAKRQARAALKGLSRACDAPAMPLPPPACQEPALC